MRVALVQLTSSDDPTANLARVEGLIREAAAGGAEFVLTPETTNIISFDRDHQNAVLVREDEDETLARLVELTADLGIHLLIGSLALKTDETRFANRSFLISPDGIVARYDKIHMFDVDLGNGESYKESAGFRPGEKAVVANSDVGKIGMAICYDMRFGALHRQLGKAGAEVITLPAAFTVPTGRAHWETLLRARAIENGCFVLAPAQCGQHSNGRRTYGHSLAVSPWGKVLADGGETEGVTFVDINLNEVAEARAKMPSLKHDREYQPPEG